MLVPATYPTDRLVAFDVGDNTMAQPLDVKRLLATGRQLTETGRTQAAQLGTDLVEQGRQATDQISAVIEQLVNPVGRGRDEDLRQTVRAEVTEQLRTVESKIKDHLADGQLAADRIAELSKQRREHTEDLREAVREEVQQQISALGLASREDLAALGNTIQDQLAALEGRLGVRQRMSPTGADESVRQADAMQMTPPHQSASDEPPTD
jgi:membrane-associated HD superfamily phosphohydrolase